MATESPSASDIVTARAGTRLPVPPRLGLALSGGGFRATLFHLGVLRRLAELDLLRHLSMISSVSGGSVLAAHYMLLLKHELEAAGGQLPPATYVAIVERLGKELFATLAKAPRNKLLVNPFANLRMAFLGASRWRTSLAERMAKSYQRLLLEPGTRSIAPTDHEAIERGLRLPDMKVKLPALTAMNDSQAFNAFAKADCIPQLVLNSATLNTATRFTFTFAEVGDEVLGYVRFDERALLAHYRRVLDAWAPTGTPEEAAGLAWEKACRIPSRFDGEGLLAEPASAAVFVRRPFIAELLAWFHGARLEQVERAPRPSEGKQISASQQEESKSRLRTLATSAHSDAVRYLARHPEHSQRFVDVSFSVLRLAKVSAWYLLHEEAWRPYEAEEMARLAPEDLRRGGYTRAEHRDRFWSAVRDVDQVMARENDRRERAPVAPTSEERHWFEFVLDFYLLRVAWHLDVDEPRDVRLPIAVQASANFPPVFGAMELDGLFDRKRVPHVQLSDGGLNDNNGLEALLDGRCTHIIASDAGPRPGIHRHVAMNRLGLLNQIMVNQLPIVRRLLLRTLREQERVHVALASRSELTLGRESTEKLRDLWWRYPVEAVAFFYMDSNLSDGVSENVGEKQRPTPLPPHPFAREIALLRTDLDDFNTIEQDALLYQGYQYADRFVRRYVYDELAKHLPLPETPPDARSPAPLPEPEECAHVRSVLRAGGSRFFRARRMGGGAEVQWWGVTAMAILVLAGLACLLAWGRSELLSFRHVPHAIAPHAIARWHALDAVTWGTLSLFTWLIDIVLWLLAAMDVAGFWIWADGRLASRAARRRKPRVG